MNEPPKKKRGPAVFIALGCGVIAVMSVCLCAGLGYPAYQDYIVQSKRTEAISNLKSLFTGAASYYAMEQMGVIVGIGEEPPSTACTVGPAITPNTPGPEKQMLTGPLGPSFDDLGFAVYDPVYYQYEIEAGPSACNHPATPALYTFRARGDLDGDGALETVELVAGANEYRELYRAPQIWLIDDEGERTIIDE